MPGTTSSSPEPRVENAAVAAPRPHRPLTARAQGRPASIEPFVWVSVHGGAGGSSLRRSTSAGLHLSHQWPDPLLGWPSRVVLVCRSNGAGLDAVGQMLQEWVSRSVPDVEVLAVVVVADAPTKPSKRTRERIAELRSIAPRVLPMAWVEQWRDHPYTPHPAAAAVAAAVEAALAETT